MATSEFAFLTEVWGEESQVSPPNPSCQLLSKKKGKMDNIMDAYMADANANANTCKQSTQDPYLKMEKRSAPFDIEAVEGYNVSNPLYSQSFGFNSYYDDDIKASSPITVDKRSIKEPSPVCMESYLSEEDSGNNNSSSSGLTREEIYRDIIEKYGPASIQTESNSKSMSTSIDQKEYIELFVYIISGIFLIFFMEQILKLGSMLK